MYNNKRGDNMDFYNEIMQFDNESAKKITKERLNYLEDNSINGRIIGYHIGSKFSKHEVVENNGKVKFDLDISCFHPGYIKKNTKVVYGLFYDNLGNASNNGNYYYVDYDKYIYDFIDFILEKDVVNEIDLFGYVLDFLKEYFGVIEKIKREDMFKLILDKNEDNMDPISEHKLSSFKGKGNAMCTEYAVMAQNILSVFGIDSYLMIGTQKLGSDLGEWHAFNLVSFVDENNIEKSYLVDFCNCVGIFDKKFNRIGYNPFIREIDPINQKLVDEIINNNKHLVLPNYNYYVLGDSIFEITDGRFRDYNLDNNLYGKQYVKRR